MTEVHNALKHLKQTGTRDLDGLDTKSLRLAAPLITNTLAYVFNLCIMKSTFLNAFKIAKVIPLYKSGDSANPSNYWPISIVSVLSKPLEKHINKHILAPALRQIQSPPSQPVWLPKEALLSNCHH